MLPVPSDLVLPQEDLLHDLVEVFGVQHLDALFLCERHSHNGFNSLLRVFGLLVAAARSFKNAWPLWMNLTLVSMKKTGKRGRD
jgi:hypothetical protein